MKKIATLILLFAFAAQTFGQGITLLNFYIHQTYITTTQCENRFKPMLHCNGKCVLAKKLQQQQKKEQQNPERKLQNKSEAGSSCSFFPALRMHPLKNFFAYLLLSSGAVCDRSVFIFHPPC